MRLWARMYGPFPVARFATHLFRLHSTLSTPLGSFLALRQRTLLDLLHQHQLLSKHSKARIRNSMHGTRTACPAHFYTAPPVSDMIAPPGHFNYFGPLGFPLVSSPHLFSRQWVCQGIDRHKNCLSSSYGAVGSVTACPPHYQVFQLNYPLMKFPGIGVALRAHELLHLVPRSF